jgi:membrane-bound lytic murein transglycosylase D
MKTRAPALQVLVLSLAASAFAVLPEDKDLFPTPDIIEPNVAFWKKIYTEVSTNEGLLHDRDYPLIIYDTLKIGKRAGRSRTQYIRTHRRRVEAWLNSLRNNPPSAWTAREKAVKELFDTYAPGELADADSRIRFQQGQRERYLEGLRRSGMYLDTIRAILTQYKVPLTLSFLPHVESSFDHRAYSKVGAAGLWQFMRGTGRAYLTINYLIDERRDPILSSIAAAKHLSRNYAELKRWPLAITAYNHGLYGMKRAVARTGSRDIAVIIQKHRSRSFKFASKNFYSCFLAAAAVAAAPSEYFPKVKYRPRLVYNDFTLTHYVRPGVLAEYLGIPQHTLHKLNPALRPVVYRHQKLIPKGYTIHVPVDISRGKARIALGNIPDSLKFDEPERPRYYRVRRGDNLYAIAYRMGVSVRDLALENDITRLNRIYAGQVLRIPGAAAAKKIASAKPKPKAKTQVAVAGKDVVKPPPSAEEEPSTEEKPPEKDAVAAADTAISDSLREIVMTPADTVTRSTVARRPSTLTRFDVETYGLETVLSPASDMAEITVSVNETIGHYADWLGIPTWRIRRLNRMRGRSTIHLSGKLNIPVEGTKALEEFAQRRLEYHMAIEEDFYTRYKIVDVKRHRIRRGETLWDICNEDGIMPLWLFKKYNKHIALDHLNVGTTVWIPVIDEKTEEDLALEAMESAGIYPAYYEPLKPYAGPLRLVP